MTFRAHLALLLAGTALSAAPPALALAAPSSGAVAPASLGGPAPQDAVQTAPPI